MHATTLAFPRLALAYRHRITALNILRVAHTAMRRRALTLMQLGPSATRVTLRSLRPGSADFRGQIDSALSRISWICHEAYDSHGEHFSMLQGPRYQANGDACGRRMSAAAVGSLRGSSLYETQAHCAERIKKASHDPIAMA